MLLMLLLTLPGQSGCGLGSAGVWCAPSVMFTAQAQVINTLYVAANKLRGRQIMTQSNKLKCSMIVERIYSLWMKLLVR